MSRTEPRPASRRDRRAQARYERPAKHRAVHRTDKRQVWQSPVVVTTFGAVLLGLVVIGFATGAIGGGSGSGTGGAGLNEPATSYAGLTVDGTAVGRADAPVSIEVFSDFQCPACKLFITTELPSLLSDFVRPGEVRVVSKDIDVIDRGGSGESLELATGAACAADQGRYWPYHDLVFWNQGRENQGDHDAAFIQRIATGAGLDMAAFKTCDLRQDLRQAIRQATSDARSAGLTATPTLRINGKTFTGVPQYADLKAYLTQLIASLPPTTTGTVAPAATPAPSAS